MRKSRKKRITCVWLMVMCMMLSIWEAAIPMSADDSGIAAVADSVMEASEDSADDWGDVSPDEEEWTDDSSDDWDDGDVEPEPEEPSDSEPVPEPVPEPAPEPTPEPTPEAEPEVTPEEESNADSEASDTTVSIPESVIIPVAIAEVQVAAGALSAEGAAELKAQLNKLYEYGIAVSTLSSTGTLMTNMAVLNVAEGSDITIKPNLLGGYEIPVIIANAGGKVTLPPVTPNPVFRIAPEDNSNVVVENESDRHLIKKIYQSKEELNAAVSGILQASGDAVKATGITTGDRMSLSENDGQYTLDTTVNYGSAEAVVVDLSLLAPMIADGKLTIKKPADQKLILRGNSGVQKIKAVKLEVDGHSFTTEASGDKESDQNKLLKEYAAENLIWDLTNCGAVELADAAGTFLIAKATKVTVSGTCTGFIAGDGEVTFGDGAGWNYLGTPNRAATVTLSVKKAAEGKPDDLPIPQAFTFALKQVTPDAPMPAKYEAVNGPNGSATFGSIDFSAYKNQDKEFIYKIEEVSVDPAYSADWKLSTTPVYAKVTSEENGSLYAQYYTDAACEGEGDSSISITNYYKMDPPTPTPTPTPTPVPAGAVEVEIPVKKTLAVKQGFALDSEGKQDSFQFALTPLTTGREADAATLIIDSSDLPFDHDGDNYKYFIEKYPIAKLVFDAPGTYEYEVKEIPGAHTGYYYAEEAYRVKVVVEENKTAAKTAGTASTAEEAAEIEAIESADKTLSATVTYEKKASADSSWEPSASSPAFVNRYAPAGVNVTLRAMKGLYVKWGFTVGSALKNEETFEFILKPLTTGNDDQDKASGAGTEESAAYISTSDLKYYSEKADNYKLYTGTVEFDKLKIAAPGVYKYSMQETAGSKAGYEYDSAVHLVTLTVTDNNGKLEVNYSYSKQVGSTTSEEKTVTFSNQYAPERVEHALKVIKKIEGNGAKKGTFEFWLTRASLAGKTEAELKDYESKNASAIRKLKIEGEGENSFALSFGTPGNYTYYVMERTKSASGMVCDSSEYRVAVKVTDEGGVLKKEVSCTKKGVSTPEAVFTNRYASGEFTFYKVNSEDHSQPVSGAEYGIYRIASDDPESDSYKRAAYQLSGGKIDHTLLKRVETKTSGTNGKVQFENLAVDSYYVIKEEKAPATRFRLSTQEIILHTESTNDEVKVTVVSSGNGTVGSEDGRYKWFEKPIRLIIDKKTSSGEYLAGAKMGIHDKTTDKRFTWTTGEEGYEVSSKVPLALDHVYEIVELTAPKGYEKAETQTIEIKDVDVQRVTVIDETTGSNSKTNGNGTNSNGTTSGAAGSKTEGSTTGDTNPVLPNAMAMSAAAMLLAAFYLASRKKR